MPSPTSISALFQRFFSVYCRFHRMFPNGHKLIGLPRDSQVPLNVSTGFVEKAHRSSKFERGWEQIKGGWIRPTIGAAGPCVLNDNL
jgi:hypothetical protein